VAWYGRGPGECYADSKQAQRVGMYDCLVDDLHTPYVRPQENGNRTDVRWVSFSDLRGMGLLAQGQPTLDFSAHWYTTNDLDEAAHTIDLPRRDFITLNLDYAQNGLGSGSCGPGTLERYWLRPEEFTFRLRLRPFSLDAASPSVLARQNMAELWG
jgi:beta-galactosidase/evolved beta-galactosidase subunit alpha